MRNDVLLFGGCKSEKFAINGLWTLVYEDEFYKSTRWGRVWRWQGMAAIRDILALIYTSF